MVIHSLRHEKDPPNSSLQLQVERVATLLGAACLGALMMGRKMLSSGCCQPAAVNQHCSLVCCPFMGFSLHLPRAASFVFPGHQLRDGQHKQSSSDCCGCLVSPVALQQAQGQPSASASLTEGAAASAAVTGQLQAGTQAVAAQDHAGSHHVSQVTLSVLASAWCNGVAASQQWHHQLPLGKVLQCAGLSVCPAAIHRIVVKSRAFPLQLDMQLWVSGSCVCFASC